MSSGHVDNTIKAAVLANTVFDAVLDATAINNWYVELGAKIDGNYDEAHANYLSTIGLFRQAIINPFEVWQRGNTFTPSSGTYMSDRWYCTNNTNSTFTKQTTSPPVGSSSYARVTVNVLGGFMHFAQALASDVCNKLKGKNVSMSIQMRRSATYDGQYQIIIQKNVVGDTSGGTWVDIASATFTPTTSWAIYKLENVVIPNDSSSNGLRMIITASGGTRPAASYVEFAQPQMNTESLALLFQPNSYLVELALCQRFYEFLDTARVRYLDASATVIFARDFRPKRIVPTPTITTVSGTALTVNATRVNSIDMSLTGPGVTESTYNIKLDAEL